MIESLPQWAGVTIAIGTLAYTIISNRSKATAQKVRDVDLRVEKKADKADTAELFARSNEHEHRITKLEADLRHLPDKDSAHKLELSVSKMSGEMAVLTEQLKPVTAMAARIQEALIEQVRFK